MWRSENFWMPLNCTQARDSWKLGIATIMEGVARFRTQGHRSDAARKIEGKKKNRRVAAAWN